MMASMTVLPNPSPLPGADPAAVEPASPQPDGVHPHARSRSRRGGAAARHRERRREIVLATRALFDQREMRDANIDDIARSVGVNRAIIYRHFSSKDELFALTLAEYLQDLAGRLEQADDESLPPPDRLAVIAEAYADFCLKFPAFLDCALAILRQPGNYLLNELSESALQQLGQRLVSCLSQIAAVLRDGAATGHFAVEDADLTANMIYLQTLGTLHLARTGFIVRASAGGGAEAVPVDEDQFRRLVVRSILAAAGSVSS